MKKEFKDVKVGDIVICYDEYIHDYVQHKLKITSIEYDDENGLVAYGDDLTYSADEYEEEYLSRVDEGNFVCFA